MLHVPNTKKHKGGKNTYNGLGGVTEMNFFILLQEQPKNQIYTNAAQPSSGRAQRGNK